MNFQLKYVTITFLCFISVALFYGCGKEEKYPIEPVITFKSIDVVGKSNFKLVFSFTDGDGDIGFPLNDTSVDYNCFVDLSIKSNGAFNVIDFGTGATYSGIIPDITPKERNKNIKGDITFAPQGLFLDSSFFNNPVDTFKMDVYIIDKAGHKSNAIATPEFLFSR